MAAYKPDDPADPMLTTVAKEIFKVAIDEMRHFRWVNEALVKLGEQPVFSRATKLSKPPGRSKFRQQQTNLVLEGLTPESLNCFIEIEKPSQQYGPDEIAGLYTHILVSLDQHPARYEEYSDDEREQLQEVCKLIIDEGADHWRRAVRVQELLRGHDPKDYLRFDGGAGPSQPPLPNAGSCRLGGSLLPGDAGCPEAGLWKLPTESGSLIRKAAAAAARITCTRSAIYSPHAAKDCCSRRRGSGPKSGWPAPNGGSRPGGPSTSGRSTDGPSTGGLSAGTVPLALATSIPRLLSTLKASGSDELAEVARRHGQTMSELLYVFTDGAGRGE